MGIFTRPYSILAKLGFIILAVIIFTFLAVTLVQAEESKPADSSDKVITDLPGSGAAGAHWVGPWKPGGAKKLDTRRPEPPANQVATAPALGPAKQTDISPFRSPLPALDADKFEHDLFIRRKALDRKFFRDRRFHPRAFGFFTPFGIDRLRRPFITGRGTISAGRFRKFHPVSRGRGFKGGGFRRR